MPPLRPAGKTYTPSSTGEDATSSSSGSSSGSSELPKYLRARSKLRRVWMSISSSLNFYRLHMIFFTFTPLIVAAIFYAANGEIHIPFIDCLFNCVSAMTVTGLATVNLSTLTGFQQALLFVLMLIGSPVSVSLVMITVRRHFFHSKFKNIVENERQRQRRRLSFSTFTVSGEGGGRFRRPSFFGGPRGERAEGDETPEEKRTEQVKEKERKVKEANKEKEKGKVGAGGRPGWFGRSQSGLNSGGVDVREAGGLRTSMIRRVEGEVPMLINMAGQRGGVAVERVPTPRMERPESVDEEGGGEGRRGSHQGERVASPDQLAGDEDERPTTLAPLYPSNHTSPPAATSITIAPPPAADSDRRGSAQTDSALSATQADPFPRSKTIAFDPTQVAAHQHVPHHAATAVGSSAAGGGHGFPRTGTIEFRERDEGLGRRHPSVAGGGTAFERTNTRRSEMTGRTGSAGFPRTATMRTTAGGRSVKDSKHSGFGGFPMPHEIARSLIQYFFPKFERQITRNLTFQRTATIQRPTGAGFALNRTGTAASGRSYTGTINPAGMSGGPVPVPYISFDAVVGRNSRFQDLTSEQMEELGGVEYRALKVLLWIVPCYILFMQISGWVIFWPYIDAKGRYDDVFESQPRFVPIGWFAAFQSSSAFSNTGMSLVDTSMVPFQTAYLMTFYMILLILAGNTAYPIFLRFVIWMLSKFCAETSRLHETCRFLLDHPRRCYIYLFPAHQTMFLLAIIFLMSMVDWVSFLVLDIGTPTVEAIPIGTRISAAFLQSAAVRAAGFAIVPLNSLAPAVKVLYALMMYVSVYPIAMSVRSTNVYEERSLGLFEEDDDSDDGEDAYQKDAAESKVAGWTRYLAFHARRQLAFDMWWLGLALWLICIIERAEINNPANNTTFNIFNIMFELISGYGTVGLSLGVANDNYSLSGGFKTLSKLVVIAVMIRGRHRGLPVAIDRAVMLPKELLEVDADLEEENRARQSRRSSLPSEARSDSRSRRDSNNSFSAGAAPRQRPSQPWFPSSSQGDVADESALSDDDAPPLPPQTNRAGLGTGRHPVGPPLAPVKEMPSAAISRNPSREDLTSSS